MRKKKICTVCGEKLLLTEITADTGNKVWAYLCGCNEMVRNAKLQNKSPNIDYAKCDRIARQIYDDYQHMCYEDIRGLIRDHFA